MKILYLPENIASINTNTAKAINKIDGITAKCLTASPNKYLGKDVSNIILPAKGSKKNITGWTYKYFKNLHFIKKLIDEADVLHYVFGPAVIGGIDLNYAHLKNKPIFIEWMGSDIRDPTFLCSINKYYKEAFENGYEYKKIESGNNKRKVQQMFKKSGAIPVVCPEMSMYVDRELFPQTTILFQRIFLQEYIPKYEPANKKPLLIHSPTAPVAKGTSVILEAVEQLKKKYDFDFHLLKNLKREQVLKLMEQADIFIDQVILGSYGMAAIEAMAFGKPVMCFLLPQVFEAGIPSNCPIVNTNPDNITEQLEKLLIDQNLRIEIGKKGREYVEKYHDADKISRQLVDLYKNNLTK